jgi:hypothetical protein
MSLRSPAKIGACGMAWRVMRKLGQANEFVDEHQSRRRSIAHAEGYGAVERDHRRTLDAQQRVVKADDLRPVCHAVV